MRFFLLLALTSAAFLPRANAQTTFGVQAGLSVATLDFENELEGADEQARLGAVAGVFARIPVTPTVAFQPELNYTQKGHKLVADGDDVDGSVTFKFDYLEVPLLAHAAFPVGANGLTVGVEVGPALAYRLSSGLSCSGDILDAVCDQLEDGLDDELSTFDVGAIGGLSVGAGPFSVALRYTHGFMNINDAEEADDDASIKNRAFTVGARYTFGR